MIYIAYSKYYRNGIAIQINPTAQPLSKANALLINNVVKCFDKSGLHMRNSATNTTNAAPVMSYTCMHFRKTNNLITLFN